MKISKEIKIAIVSIATIIAFILGANFLKGRNFFKPETTFFAFFDNANNLTPSASVFFRGMNVGRVTRLEFTGAENPQIRATIVINERLSVPKNSVARIAVGDLFGTRIIELMFSDETEFLRNGDTLIGEIETGFMEEIATQLMPVASRVESLAISLDSLVMTMNAMFNEQAQQEIQNSIQDLSISLNNARNLTSTANRMLADQRENVNEILTNFAEISNNLNNVDFASTVNSLQNTLAQADTLIQRLNEGEGTLGLLLNDERLYEELTNSAANLSRLLEDLKTNPRRYVNFSLFGRNRD
ncbi:MAG: MlaD family protein [Bacteroidales bacterium]|nr:MlaD family protein [Bacteroidales bacterium]